MSEQKHTPISETDLEGWLEMVESPDHLELGDEYRFYLDQDAQGVAAYIRVVRKQRDDLLAAAEMMVQAGEASRKAVETGAFGDSTEAKRLYHEALELARGAIAASVCR